MRQPRLRLMEPEWCPSMVRIRGTADTACFHPRAGTEPEVQLPYRNEEVPFWAGGSLTLPGDQRGPGSPVLWEGVEIS